MQQHTFKFEWLKRESTDLTNEVAIMHGIVEFISIIVNHLMIW
jgi:hypothetical protein